MMENSAQPDRIVRPREAAAILGISPSTLRRLEQRRQLAPRRVISANTRGFLLSELMDFLHGRHATHIDDSSNTAATKHLSLNDGASRQAESGGRNLRRLDRTIMKGSPKSLDGSPTSSQPTETAAAQARGAAAR